MELNWKEMYWKEYRKREGKSYKMYREIEKDGKSYQVKLYLMLHIKSQWWQVQKKSVCSKM